MHEQLQGRATEMVSSQSTKYMEEAEGIGLVQPAEGTAKGQVSVRSSTT